MCACVCVTAILCNGILLKILGHCEGKNTLSLVQESSDLQENSSMAEILQSKVKEKTQIFAHHNISSVTPIHYNTCVLDSNMRSLPKRSNSTDKQSVCVCLFLHNLGECFFSLLVEPIASKNVGYSNK